MEICFVIEPKVAVMVALCTEVTTWVAGDSSKLRFLSALPFNQGINMDENQGNLFTEEN